VPGDDQEWGASVAHVTASDKDAEITRYRPLVVIGEHGTSSKALKDRAKWENQVRMGRGKRGTCRVVGWRTSADGQDGDLWTPNTLVRVTSARMDIDMPLLVVGCEYVLNEKEGKATRLHLARPEAFQLVEGIGRSKLNAKLHDKTLKEKRKGRKGAFVNSWTLDPPVPGGTR
jgi:prophage tail gpP-like protein